MRHRPHFDEHSSSISRATDLARLGRLLVLSESEMSTNPEIRVWEPISSPLNCFEQTLPLVSHGELRR